MKISEYTKYERARIIGARALQIAMDAPLLMKVSEDKLKEMKYDSIKIAELEFKENVLPIAISRPTPKKRKDKLGIVKEEHVSDEELIEKEKEVEKEIVADLRPRLCRSLRCRRIHCLAGRRVQGQGNREDRSYRRRRALATLSPAAAVNGQAWDFFNAVAYPDAKTRPHPNLDEGRFIFVPLALF